MLRFFFDRNAPMVHLMNGLTLLLLVILIWQGALGWGGVLIGFSWLFFNLLNWINWYAPHQGKLGIRIHLQKNVVPVSYMSVVALVLKWMGASNWVLFGIFLLMAPIYYVSIILLYFHFRDTSEMMPSYFSHNFYLKDEEH
ncbi:MAG: hypothetical protein R3257_03830 [bacterium]|nr:hypothetical protein [bacterium]